VNVFLGRLNSFIADHKLGDGKYVGERAAMETQMAVRTTKSRHGLERPSMIAASLRSGQQLIDLAGVDVFTTPVAAAREARELVQGGAPVTSQIGRKFAVQLAAGASETEIGLDRLWDVTADFRDWAEGFLTRDVEGWNGETLRDDARRHGFGDLFRDWTGDEIDAITEDGKIPSYERWKAHLVSGEVSLDDLLSISALQAFVVDQKKLDARIRGMLSG
jgi:transaldolase